MIIVTMQQQEKLTLKEEQHHNNISEKSQWRNIQNNYCCQKSLIPLKRSDLYNIQVPFPVKLHEILELSRSGATTSVTSSSESSHATPAVATAATERGGGVREEPRGGGGLLLESIISWLPHGKAFRVHKPREFTDYVMPYFFKQSKYKSFQRQLHLYGFRRICNKSMKDFGAYYNESFLRENIELSWNIKRQQHKLWDDRLKSHREEHPNFYEEDEEEETKNNIKNSSIVLTNNILNPHSSATSSSGVLLEGGNAMMKSPLPPQEGGGNSLLPASICSSPLFSSSTSTTGVPIGNASRSSIPFFSLSLRQADETMENATVSPASFLGANSTTITINNRIENNNGHYSMVIAGIDASSITRSDGGEQQQEEYSFFAGKRFYLV